MKKQNTDRQELICLDELSLKDWTEIKTLAMEMLKAGQHDRDSFKCNVNAFLTWLVMKEALLEMSPIEEEIQEMSEGSRFFGNDDTTVH